MNKYLAILLLAFSGAISHAGADNLTVNVCGGEAELKPTRKAVALPYQLRVSVNNVSNTENSYIDIGYHPSLKRCENARKHIEFETKIKASCHFVGDENPRYRYSWFFDCTGENFEFE